MVFKVEPLHNPRDMGTGIYKMRNIKEDNMENKDPNKLTRTLSGKKIDPIPNPDLSGKKPIRDAYGKESKSVTREEMNLGEMKDNPPKWRVNPSSGVDYFMYSTEQSKKANTDQFDKVNTPAFTPRTKEQKNEYMKSYNQQDLEKEYGGVFFGGIKSRKRRGKKSKKNKKTRSKRQKGGGFFDLLVGVDRIRGQKYEKWLEQRLVSVHNDSDYVNKVRQLFGYDKTNISGRGQLTKQMVDEELCKRSDEDRNIISPNLQCGQSGGRKTRKSKKSKKANSRKHKKHGGASPPETRRVRYQQPPARIAVTPNEHSPNSSDAQAEGILPRPILQRTTPSGPTPRSTTHPHATTMNIDNFMSNRS